MSEPFYIVAQLQLNFGLRVATEACATMLRGVMSLVMLRCTSVPAAVALSYAQVSTRRLQLEPIGHCVLSRLLLVLGIGFAMGLKEAAA